MSTARSTGEDLCIWAGDAQIEADEIEVEAAPEQPGVILLAYTKEGVAAVYVDGKGEECDETTVRYVIEKVGPGRPPLRAL